MRQYAADAPLYHVEAAALTLLALVVNLTTRFIRGPRCGSKSDRVWLDLCRRTATPDCRDFRSRFDVSQQSGVRHMVFAGGVDGVDPDVRAVP